ncbi:MAG: hypothetical protein KC731_39610, partial [Myxococcales bacterium]|nr:hypothetical protein [Myxococcales bacterium]
IVCLAHLALVMTAARWSSRERAEEGGRVARAHLRRAVPVLAAMAILGPVVTWLLWPWLWHDTAARVAGYARFHLGHVYYNMELFGRNYFEPPMPRAYAFVMTAATVPTVTLVAAVLGAGASLRRGWRSRRRLGEPFAGAISAPLFWLLAIALVYGAWLLPTTPIFGGTKHWMTTYPFVALFAGVGVAEGVRRALAGTRRRWAPAVMGASALAVVAAPAVETLGAHPWALSAYVPLFGGAAGGATLGLNRGFWGYTTGAPRVLAELSHAPPGARIYLHDTATSAWDMLVADGHLRPDLRRTQDLAQADVLLYHQELHMQGVLFQIWGRAGTTAPQLVDGLDGVPVVLVFDASETP